MQLFMQRFESFITENQNILKICKTSSETFLKLITHLFSHCANRNDDLFANHASPLCLTPQLTMYSGQQFRVTSWPMAATKFTANFVFLPVLHT